MMDRAGGGAKREEIGNVWNFWKLHGKRDLSLDRSSTRSVFRLGAHVASTIYGILRFSLCPSLSLSRSRGAFIALRTSHHPFLTPSASRRSLSVRLPKSRQHLASSILGEIQADILSRAITVTFDHRMTGEWLTLRHQSMNFSLSARYNLQSARLRPSRRLTLARPPRTR